jgi:hypothetical protein
MMKFNRKTPDRDLGILLKVKFNFTILSLLLLLGIVLVLVYIFIEEFRAELTFISAITAGLAAIYAGYYAAKSIKIATERDKVHRAFEIIHRLDIPDFVRTRQFIEKIDIDPTKDSAVGMFKKINDDFELQSSVTSLLSMFENLSIAIQRGYVDEVTVYLSTCVQVPYYFDKLSPYINYVRKKYNSNAISIEFEKLANSWKARKFLSSGKYIPEELLHMT